MCWDFVLSFMCWVFCVEFSCVEFSVPPPTCFFPSSQVKEKTSLATRNTQTEEVSSISVQICQFEESIINTIFITKQHTWLKRGKIVSWFSAEYFTFTGKFTRYINSLLYIIKIEEPIFPDVINFPLGCLHKHVCQLLQPVKLEMI